MPATIARTGVQTYRRADGTEVREYRAPDQVFSAESLATLGGIPITIDHPGAVTPANYRQHAVGHVSDLPAARKTDASAEWVEAQLIVNDGATLARIDAGGDVPISMGYSADVVPQPGVAPDGQHYDAVQMNVRFNHLALWPVGGPRAGAGARLRLDSKGDEMLGEFKQDDAGAKRLIKVDGIDCEFGSETHVSLLERNVKAQSDRADGLAAELATANTAAGDANAKLLAANTELTALKARDVNALVQDELDFRSKHLPLLDKAYDFTGKTRDQVRADALGAELAAEVAKQPEGQQLGFANAMLKIKLDAAGTPAKPTHTPTPTVKTDGSDKPKRRDPYGDAYKATFPGAK
jgi:hypothetical protein